MNPKNRKTPPFPFFQTPIPINARHRNEAPPNHGIYVRSRKFFCKHSDVQPIWKKTKQTNQFIRQHALYRISLKKISKRLILLENKLNRAPSKSSVKILSAASIEARKIINVTGKYVTSDHYKDIKHKRNVSLQAYNCRQSTFD